MKVFTRWISIFLATMLLFAGCVRQVNDPMVEPANTEKTHADLEKSTEAIPSETEDDDSVAVKSLLGMDDLRMQTVREQYHPHYMDVKLYTYRFYSKIYGELLVIENVLRYELDDFDGDGVVELFAQTLDEKQYVFYEITNGQVVTEYYDLVPDAVLDYEMLLDADGYYLYEERWAWFLKDPAGYVAEVAKRPEDQLYLICPSGNIPAYTDAEVINAAIAELHKLLDGTPTEYEKKIIYKLLNEIQLSYLPQLAPGADFNYGRLLEQWCATSEMSTEYYNCLQQISDIFDADPMAFLKGVAAVDQNELSKDIQPVISYLVQTNYLYNANAFQMVVDRLNANAASEAEKTLASLLYTEQKAQRAPSIYVEKLLSGNPQDLWNAFFCDPGKTLRVLGGCKEEQLKPLGQMLWGMEPAPRKLLDKGYAAVDRMLGEDPQGTRKDVAYKFLLTLEWQGNYSQEYIPGSAFDYQRLFDKSTYADGAIATMCYTQMYDVFKADPEGFISALAQGDWDAESIAMHFAIQCHGDAKYLETLDNLLKNTALKECVQTFITAYQGN